VRLMGALGNGTACGTHAVIGFEIDFFVLDGAPQAFYKDVVTPSALAIHRDSDVMALELDLDGINIYKLISKMKKCPSQGAFFV